jgi:hypothetical protein
MLGRVEGNSGKRPAWIAELRGQNQSERVAGARLDAIIIEVFLRTVSRFPTGAELQNARTDIAATDDPVNGVRDLLWVMLNTREFIVNH